MDDTASVGTYDGGRDGTPRVRLRIPARVEHVALARLVLGGLAPLMGLDEEALTDLKRTVTEAASSVLAQRQGADGAVEVRYELTAGELRIEVAGDGAEPAGTALGAVAARTIVVERRAAPQPHANAGHDRFAAQPGLDT